MHIEDPKNYKISIPLKEKDKDYFRLKTPAEKMKEAELEEE